MDDRFRVDGVDLGVDRRGSFAMVDRQGVVDATIRASRRLGDAVVRLVVTRVPLRFDGEVFGATIDAEFRDRLFVEGLAGEGGRDDEEWGDLSTDPASPGPDDDVADVPAEAGVALHAGPRVEADGRLTHHAGDRLRFVGSATLPGGSPLRLDVSLTFGGRRTASI